MQILCLRLSMVWACRDTRTHARTHMCAVGKRGWSEIGDLLAGFLFENRTCEIRVELCARGDRCIADLSRALHRGSAQKLAFYPFGAR